MVDLGTTMWFPLPVSLVGQGRVTGHSRGEGSAQPCAPSCALWQVLTKQQQEQAASNDFNFDHPDAFDFDLIIATLKKLKQGKSVKIPIYDFTTHSRKKEWVWDTEGGGTGWGWPGQDRGGAKCTPPAPGLCSVTPCSVPGCVFWVSCHSHNPERFPGTGHL